MIKKFSDTTKRELKYYVYRLVDPRNGNTFYVGKGYGDRINQLVFIGKDYEKSEILELLKYNSDNNTNVTQICY